uniref:Uncharacterized protein n=1 Tax=Bacillus subtilis TaxID=1423 RepID=A0A1J0AKU8_BACIU|nr:hypothetical protein pBS72_0830 [Bacillus subtilis]
MPIGKQRRNRFLGCFSNQQAGLTCLFSHGKPQFSILLLSRFDTGFSIKEKLVFLSMRKTKKSSLN